MSRASTPCLMPIWSTSQRASRIHRCRADRVATARESDALLALLARHSQTIAACSSAAKQSLLGKVNKALRASPSLSEVAYVSSQDATPRVIVTQTDVPSGKGRLDSAIVQHKASASSTDCSTDLCDNIAMNSSLLQRKSQPSAA